MKNRIYVKPKIRMKKVKANFFLSRARVVDSFNSWVVDRFSTGVNCMMAQGSPCNSGRYI